MNGFCKFCNGVRQVNSAQQCEGCGMPAKNAIVPNSSVKKAIHKCPQCRSHRCTEIEADRFMCATCGGVFEAVEQGFVDDRPLQNAMKKERVR